MGNLRWLEGCNPKSRVFIWYFLLSDALRLQLKTGIWYPVIRSVNFGFYICWGTTSAELG